MEQGSAYVNFAICVEATKIEPFVLGVQDEVRYRFETSHPDYNRRTTFEIVGYVGQYAVGAGYPFELKVIDPQVGED